MKPGPATRALPLLPPWLAFTCAGLCAAVAGYLATSGEGWERGYSATGLALPAITELVVEAGVGVPIGLVLVAALLLAAPAVRSSAPWILGARQAAGAVALLAGGGAVLVLRSLLLSYVQLSQHL